MGIMDRLVLSDGQWARLSAHIIGTDRTRGSSGRDNLLFVEAVLWVGQQRLFVREARALQQTGNG